MNKKLITMAVAGAFAAPLSAQAVDFSVTGFGDMTYTLMQEACDDGASGGTLTFGDPLSAGSGCTTTGVTDADGSAANSTEQRFHTEGELDFIATEGDVTVRMDVDLSTGGNSASIEQLFFAWGVTDGIALRGGVFNNPLGWETEDVTGLYQVTHGQIYQILNASTERNGNNIEGVAVDFGFGPANFTLGLIDEIGGNNEAMSILAAADAEIMPGLTGRLGVLTQEDNTANNTSTAPGGSLENLINASLAYTMNSLTVVGEILSAGAIVDNAYMLMGHYAFGNGFGATLRFDTTSFEAAGTPDQDSITLAGIWEATENLEMLLEWRQDDNGGTGNNAKEDQVILEFIAHIGH